MADPRWVQLASYAGLVDADIDRAILEGAGILVLVKGPLTGAFGPGFAGATMHGVQLFVPDDALEHARTVLGAAGDEDGPDDAA
jgi:hypothetical protein